MKQPTSIDDHVEKASKSPISSLKLTASIMTPAVGQIYVLRRAEGKSKSFKFGELFAVTAYQARA